MSGLSLQGITLDQGPQRILGRLDLEVPEGQLVSILGASGSGKSSLLRLVAGLQPPSGGRLFWRSQPVGGPSLQCGVVFQDYSLFPWLTLEENVRLALRQTQPALSRAIARNRASDFLVQVGLGSACHRYPFEVSGGMQQRAALARAFALGAPLLLLDEPFGALDPLNRARLQDVLAGVWQASTPAKTVLFVTHDVEEALYLGDRVVILGSSPGRIIADLQVPLARPRQRQQLFDDPGLHALRGQVHDWLAAGILGDPGGLLPRETTV